MRKGRTGGFEPRRHTAAAEVVDTFREAVAHLLAVSSIVFDAPIYQV